MATYVYKGFDTEGHPAKGLIEALSVKQAREKLAATGVLAERVTESGKESRFNADSRAVFYHELGSLLGAGLTLEDALNVLIDSPDQANLSSLLAGIRDKIKEGTSFASALGSASKSVSSFEQAIVEAGEKSGNVELMLGRLADFVSEQDKLRERIQSAMVYPSIVVGMGICVAIVMLGLLVPRARAILEGTTVDMPVITRMVIAFGSATVTVGPILLGLGIIVALWFTAKLKNDDEFRMTWDRRSFRFPIVGRARTLLANLRFARTMSILLDGGVSVIDAFLLAGRATGSSWTTAMVSTEAETVRQGASLCDAVRRVQPLSLSLPGWIQVGEASGDLAQLLERAGARYEEQWNRFVERSLGLLEPVLILIIGGFVLVVTLAVLLPVMSLSQAMGQ